jgi:hypothetical protein
MVDYDNCVIFKTEYSSYTRGFKVALEFDFPVGLVRQVLRTAMPDSLLKPI